VIPPRVAQVQVVIVPIVYKDSAAAVLDKCREVRDTLKRAGLRVALDDRDTLTPPKKFFYHELRGVPVRLEVGPKDLAKGCCVLVRRDTGAKTMDVPLEGLPATLAALFVSVHADMLAKAKAALAERLTTVTQWADFVPALNAQRLVVAAWCDTVDCEKGVKHDSSEEAKNLVADGFALTAAAKTLCIPADQSIAGQPLPEKCFHCQNKAKVWCLFGRSY
jgi:prolyl-tRNA synthetase